jgi:hypothetical protein
MSYALPRYRGAAAVALLAVLASAPDEASAQSVMMPKANSRHITAGLSWTPTLMVDATVPEDPRWGKVAPGMGFAARVGLHQMVTIRLAMALEAELGTLYLDEHTAAPDGRARSGYAATWQVGLMGRWIPSGDATGFSLGLGMHFFGARLDDVPLQELGLEARVGYYLWNDAQDFALVEVGYVAPVIAALNLPTSFGAAAPEAVEQDWGLHRFTIGFFYGF